MGAILDYMFYFFTLYAFIPGLISRLFGFRVIKRGSKEVKAISLTFDDGPDPVYTPKLLDLLKEHQIKATFFVVGKNAEEHPEILRRMHEEGHAIGIHNYLHRTNWLMRPKTVAKHVLTTSQIIERVTGEKPKYYRPPWGILNLFDFARKHEYQIVLWSMMAGDWKAKTGADKIRERMCKRLGNGKIYLLHDCGRTFGADVDAPANTIEALSHFIPYAIQQGYAFARVDELMQMSEKAERKTIGWFKRSLVQAWLAWERCFHALFRLKPAVPDDPKNSFLFYRITNYRGEPIPLAEGEKIENGDKIIELHMNNALLYQYSRKAKSPMQLAIQLIRTMERTMPAFAETLLKHQDLSSVKAMLGTSMVNRGAEQFGFTVVDLPKGWFSSISRIYLKILLSVIHPQGKDRLQQRAELLVPKRIAMSVGSLVKKYGEAVSEAAAAKADGCAVQHQR